MRKDEQTIEIVCYDCGRHFKQASELLVFFPPRINGKAYAGHLKCPYCRGNKFVLTEPQPGTWKRRDRGE